MSRTLKRDIPGPDWRRGVDALRDDGWRSLFAPELDHVTKLVVEIGFGRGEFLMKLAERASDTAFLGIEVSFKRVLKVARRLARSELLNVRLLQSRGELIVEQLLPPQSVGAFWINFSDPWPKKRHARRRLIQAPFARNLARCLIPGGELHVATDHDPYAEEIHEVLSHEIRLENALAPDPWLPEMHGREPTAYELEWRAEGRPLHFFRYVRRAGSEQSSSPRAQLRWPCSPS